MFRHTRRTLAATAFCFGLAFSLSALAAGCQECWDNCFAKRLQCRAAGNPVAVCTAAYQACGRGCGCPIP